MGNDDRDCDSWASILLSHSFDIHKNPYQLIVPTIGVVRQLNYGKCMMGMCDNVTRLSELEMYLSEPLNQTQTETMIVTFSRMIIMIFTPAHYHAAHNRQQKPSMPEGASTVPSIAGMAVRKPHMAHIDAFSSPPIISLSNSVIIVPY